MEIALARGVIPTEGSMRTAACILAAAGLLGVTASVARAQYPQRREGFWIGFGLGYGSANVTCDTCGSGPRTGGVTAFLKLGGTPSRNLLIGGAINGWSHPSSGATETMGNVTASLYYYPVAGGGAPFATGWKQNVVDFGLGVTFH